MMLAPDTMTIEPWAVAGRVAVGLSATSVGILVFTWRALLRALWCAGMKACAADLKECVDASYKERIARVDSAVEKVGVHEDQIEYLDTALKEQGKALMANIAEAINQQTKAMHAIAHTSEAAFRDIKDSLELVRDETAANTSEIANISGFLRGQDASYTGPERRAGPKSSRRKSS
jgi:hypothetical protein